MRVSFLVLALALGPTSPSTCAPGGRTCEPGAAGSGTARVGDPAPPLALRDLDGELHRLADQRGRIVVLEWTSHLCPAVAAVHEPGLVADARAALDPERVAWWQVDSSWFAPELSADVRAWRRSLGLAVPYLLDPDGAAALAFGATATPGFFVVDAEGRLAYSGALDDGGPEPERVDHVVDAVRALLAAKPVATPRTRAHGCSIKLERPDGARAEEWDEDARATRLYREARDAALAGDGPGAVETLGRAVGAGLPRPWRVLSDPAFRGPLTEAATRRSIRSLLADHPARGRLSMVAPDEPGEPLVLCGTVRGEDGEPIAGALLSLYQTDDAGWYAPGSTAGDDSRLIGRVATDARGRWRVRTILPGAYADSGGPRHVHCEFRAPGRRTFGGHPASVYFADDPALAGADREEIESDGCAILERRRNAEGVSLAVYDVVLRRE